MKYKVITKVIILAILYASCSSKKPIRIIPLSPYTKVGYYNEDIKTTHFIFAIDNFSDEKANLITIDSFVRKNIPISEISSKNHIVFSFYKYVKNKFDENFKQNDENKYGNLFLDESNSELLVLYDFDTSNAFFQGTYKKNKIDRYERRSW
jgi:hypothetical protein